MPYDFWSRIEHGESCWTWRGTIGSDGYGEFKMDRVTWKAHRLAFFLSFGFIARVIARRSDNPTCVNPQHLFAANRKGERIPDPNSDERLRGSRHGRAKIDEDDVLWIRQLRRKGAPYRQIAKQFPLDPMTIGEIVRRETWKHVP